MGSIVVAQAMRPPQMSFTATEATSDPLIFSSTCTAFWESLPSLQITNTGQSRQTFADFSMMKRISLTKQIRRPTQGEKCHRTNKCDITKFSPTIKKANRDKYPDDHQNNLLHSNFTKADQLHRLTGIVLEKGSPSNSSSQKQADTLYGEYAQVHVHVDTNAQPLNGVLELPLGWKSPDFPSFNWLIFFFSNWTSSGFLSSKHERGISGNNIRKIITNVLNEMANVEFFLMILLRILREKGKWHMSTSTRGRTSNKRWGSAWLRIDSYSCSYKKKRKMWFSNWCIIMWDHKLEK